MIKPAYDRDAIRMLVMSIGYKQAAEKTGIKYATLRQWAKRGKWFTKQPHPLAVTHVTSPSTVLATTLTELEHETKLSLAKSVNRMAKDSEQATLRQSPYVHKVAQTFAIVHPQDVQSNNILNLNVLVGTVPDSKTKALPNETSPVIDV